MKAKVIQCDRCPEWVREDSREAVSYTQVSVLKGGVCKEIDLCPNDADALKVWLANEDAVAPEEPSVDAPVPPTEPVREFDPNYGYGPRPGERGDILS